MTDNEKAVMTDCYKLLNMYSNPPAKDDNKCDEYWNNLANECMQMSEKHKQHPLAIEIGAAIMMYLQKKWHAINRKKGLE